MTNKYKIVVKRDFGSGKGFWLPGAGSHGTDNYGWVKSGFVVTLGGCNIMPGATWFRTIADAMRAIAVYENTSTSDEFWAALRNKQAAA